MKYRGFKKKEGTKRRVDRQKNSIEVNFFMFYLKVASYWLKSILVLVP